MFQKSYSKDYLAHKSVGNQGELPQYLIEDHHPSIIEPELYEAVQQEIKRWSHGKQTAKKHDHQTVFFKKLYCAECGALMNHTSYSAKQADGKRKNYHYWRCGVALGKDFSTECQARGYREEIIEKTFMKMLKEMKDHPQLIYETKQVIQEIGMSEQDKLRVEGLNQELKAHYQDLITANEMYHKCHSFYHIVTKNVPANAMLFTS